MDLRAFRYYVETVRHSSFTVAAETLCVTQSTVSKMIRQLEDEIGQPLLIREGRALRMTDVGQILYVRGQEALGVVRQLSQEVSDLTELARGELTVGMPPMVNLFFSPVVKAFCVRHPGVRLNLQENGGQRIVERVDSGELEVGATLLPVAADLTTRCFGRYPIVAVGPRGAIWSGDGAVSLARLADEPLVLLNDDFSLTRRLRDAFREAHIVPRVAAQSGQWDFLVALAAAGLGTALLPAPLIERLAANADLAIRPLADPTLDWSVAMVWKAERYMSHAARAWLALCDEILAPATA